MSISADEYFQHKGEHILLDVRSPKEYQEGHIINAISLPLFSDEERAKVGTIYKNSGSYDALLSGLDIVGPKMKGFVTKARELAGNKPIFVYCWRGGKRSESIDWLLSLAGFDVNKIEGGYKAIRNFMLKEYSNNPNNLLILSGATGSGKTKILHSLREKGEQIIDLEGLANHKGSSFGALGQERQPTSEQFNNNLYQIYKEFDKSKRIWVENESRTVGKVFIGELFWKLMQASKTVEITVPVSLRIDFLVEEYGSFKIDDLKDAFDRISKRLGGQNTKNAIEFLEKKQIAEATEIALDYYDKAYLYSRKKRNQKVDYNIDFDHMDFTTIADKLITMANINKL